MPLVAKAAGPVRTAMAETTMAVATNLHMIRLIVGPLPLVVLHLYLAMSRWGVDRGDRRPEGSPTSSPLVGGARRTTFPAHRIVASPAVGRAPVLTSTPRARK